MSIVSDHALIRWLERAHGIEMEDIRKVLEEKVRPYAKAGCTRFVSDGLHFEFRGGRLVTVLPSPPSRMRLERK